MAWSGGIRPEGHRERGRAWGAHGGGELVPGVGPGQVGVGFTGEKAW